MLRYCKSIYVLHIHTTTTAHGFVSVQASCYRRISAISSKRIGVPRLQPHNVCVQYGPRSDLHQISLRVRLDLVLSLDSGSTSGFSLEWGKRGEGEAEVCKHARTISSAFRCVYFVVVVTDDDLFLTATTGPSS